jgi:hypothetical protein
MLKTRIILNGLVHGLSAMTIKDYEYEALLETDGDLMFESVTLEELDNTYLYGKPMAPAPMFEAITTTKNRIDRTMMAFHRELTRQFTGTDIAPEVAEISKPKISAGFATLTARFPLSDGQSIGIIFHSPSGDPAKIVEADVLVAFRFVLNKRDVTPTVAPAGGVDVSLKQVTLKLANLAERNSAKFQAAQAKNKAKKAELTTIQNETEAKGLELSELSSRADSTESEAVLLVDRAKTYTLALSKAGERIGVLKKRLAALQAQAKPAKPAEQTGDTPEASPTPSVAMTENDNAEIKHFIKTIARDIKVYEMINTGDPSMAGMDARAFSTSISNRVKTLHKNGKQAVVDGVLAHIAQVNPSLTKPLFTDRHKIWTLGSGKPIEETAKPASPAKPVQDKATNEVLAYRHYAKLSGNLEERPSDAVGVMKGNQLSAAPEVVTMVAAKALGDVAGVLVYTKKLTDADITKYGLVDITPDAVELGSDGSLAIDFKTEVSNLISTHFGKTWHEIGLEDPYSLPKIISGDPRFNTAQRDELMKVVAQYQIDKRIADSQAIFGAGDLHWYGLRARPLSFGASPKAQVVVQLDNAMASVKFPLLQNSNSLRHGAVAYLEPLSQEDIKSYEFVDLAAGSGQLDDEDYEYAMADLVTALLDRHGESSMRIAPEVVESIIQGFNDNRVMFIAKITRNVEAFKSRKVDPETYENFKIFSEQVTAKALEEELMKWAIDSDGERIASEPAQTPKSTVIKLLDGFTGYNGVSLQYAENKGEYIVIYNPSDKREPEFALYKNDQMAKDFTFEGFNEFVRSDKELPVFILDALKSVDMGKHIDASGKMTNSGQDAILDAFFSEERIQAYFGGLGEMTKFVQDVKADHNNGSKPFMQTYQGAEGEEFTPAQEGTGELPPEQVENEVIKTLEDALVNESDVEALINILEKAIEDLEQAGTYDENEALVEKVSDRITELLVQEGPK